MSGRGAGGNLYWSDFNHVVSPFLQTETGSVTAYNLAVSGLCFLIFKVHLNLENVFLHNAYS